LLDGLFPADVVVEAAGADARAGALFDVEEEAIARAIEKRRRDFALGRTCARAALQRLGVAPVAIPVGAKRAPAWPPGVVGAITHCEGLAAAAVAWQDRYSGIGLDAEVAAPLEPALARLISTPAERERHAEADAPHGTDWTKLTFSAKESVHKAVAPLSGVTLGFHDVELFFDVDSSTFRTVLVGAERTGLPAFDRLEGTYRIRDGYVITAVTIRSAVDRATPHRQTP
jgi:4'-phosphopantetheinyl transferase EntD